MSDLYREWRVIVRGDAEKRAELERGLIDRAVELGVEVNIVILPPVSDGDATDVQEAPEH